MFRQTHVAKQGCILRLFEHKGIGYSYIEIMAIITGEQSGVSSEAIKVWAKFQRKQLGKRMDSMTRTTGCFLCHLAPPLHQA